MLPRGRVLWERRVHGDPHADPGLAWCQQQAGPWGPWGAASREARGEQRAAT